MKKIISILIVLSMLLSFNTSMVFADGTTQLVDNFSLNFTGMPSVASNNRAGNLANNGYYMKDGVKTYGGIDGFYGHFRANGSDNEFQLDDNTLKGVSVLNYDGNVLQLSPCGNSGYNLSASFGRYDDLKLSGVSVFEFMISTAGNTNKTTVNVSIVQDKAANNDNCAAEYKILTIDTGRNVYFDGGSNVIATLAANGSYSTQVPYLKVTYVLDNSGATPRHCLKITDVLTNNIVADLPYTALAQITDSNFDFTKDYFGIKFKAISSGEWGYSQHFIMKSLSFNKPQPFEVTTSADAFIGDNALKPNTDGQKVTLTFEKNVIAATVNTDNISLLNSQNEEMSISVNPVTATTAEITLPVMENGKDYRLIVSGVTATDYSAVKDCELKVGILDCLVISNITKTINTEIVETVEVKKAKLDISIINNSSQNENCVMIITRRDSNNVLRPGIFAKNFTMTPGNGVYQFETNITEENLSDTYNIFLWKGINDITTLGPFGTK